MADEHRIIEQTGNPDGFAERLDMLSRSGWAVIGFAVRDNRYHALLRRSIEEVVIARRVIPVPARTAGAIVTVGTRR